MYNNFKIEWNSFSDFLSESNKNLYGEKDFVDVTLVSDDLTEVEAHKTVLSHASPVLKKLLKIKPVNHPVLFLRGIQGKTLEALVQFIYLGETTIQEDRIQEFANIANDLNIQELNNILPRIRASLPPAPAASFKSVPQKPPVMTSSRRKLAEREQSIVKREVLRQETPPPQQQNVPQQQRSYPIATIKNEATPVKKKKLKMSKTSLVARMVSTPNTPAIETNNLSYLSSNGGSKSQELKNLNSFFSEVKAETSSSQAVLNRSLPFLSNTQHASPVVETPEEQLLTESQSLSFLLETQDGKTLDIPDMTQEVLSGHEVDFQKLITSGEAPHGQEHEMELPWKCEECDKGFITDKELEKHAEQHRAYRAHQVPTFPCDECPKVLSRKSGLWSHKNTVHSKKKTGLEDKLFNGLNWF